MGTYYNDRISQADPYVSDSQRSIPSRKRLTSDFCALINFCTESTLFDPIIVRFISRNLKVGIFSICKDRSSDSAILWLRSVISTHLMNSYLFVCVHRDPESYMKLINSIVYRRFPSCIVAFHRRYFRTSHGIPERTVSFIFLIIVIFDIKYYVDIRNAICRKSQKQIY